MLKLTKTSTLKIGDYEAITGLWERAGLPFKPKGRDSKQKMKEQMKISPDLFIGAFHGKRLVGVIIGSYENRKKGWLNRLAVDPEYRRKGVAQQLIKRMEEALAKHGAMIFCALIEAPNEESQNLFRKMGYVTHQDILYVSKRKSQDI